MCQEIGVLREALQTLLVSNHPFMKSQTNTWGVSEVLEATGGRLVFGEATTRFVGVSTDSRMVQRSDLFVALQGKKYDGHYFVQRAFEEGALGAVVQEAYVATITELPDVAKGRCWIAVSDTLRALGDLAAFRRRQSKASVVAITGTNGKTTTKEMTASVLSQVFAVLKTPGNFNNLIGLPLTLFDLREYHEWAVLELAMNRPGEIERLAQICVPQVGVITNIGAGHLQGVKDINGVMRAKGELLNNLSEGGTAVLNIDDERVCRLAEKFKGPIISFGTDSSADVRATSICHDSSSCSFELCWSHESTRVKLRMPGTGAVYDALGAAAVGHRLGLFMGQVKTGLETVTALPGRMEILTLPGGIRLMNDTYNANLGSMTLAIDTLRALKGRGRSVCVIGDMMELGDHAQGAHKQLGKLVAQAGTARLCAAGGFAKAVAEGAIGAGMDPGDIFLGSHEEIVEHLRGRLVCGDWILVKGSRLMAMEKVVEGLQSKIGKGKPGTLDCSVPFLECGNVR